MNDGGDLREDLKIPDGDLGTQLKTDFDNGRELLVSQRICNVYEHNYNDLFFAVHCVEGLW
jgi:hypothetical protein